MGRTFDPLEKGVFSQLFIQYSSPLCQVSVVSGDYHVFEVQQTTALNAVNYPLKIMITRIRVVHVCLAVITHIL